MVPSAMILFMKFFCAGGLVFRKVRNRTEAGIETLNPMQSTANV